jgi:hypothetical protein
MESADLLRGRETTTIADLAAELGVSMDRISRPLLLPENGGGR